MESEQPQRLRPPPSERFAGPQHRFDLRAAAEQLRQEGEPATGRHRQTTLYKHGTTTLALFLFPAQSRLAPHRTNGTVIIHVLRGHMTVTADGQVNDLTAGGVVVLASGVQHEVAAQEESEMLLTVQLEARPAES